MRSIVDVTSAIIDSGETLEKRRSLPSSTGDGVQLLDIQEAADYLNVSKSTIRRWGNMGILECVRINGRGDRRFVKSSLDAVVAPRRTGRPKKKRETEQAADNLGY